MTGSQTTRTLLLHGPSEPVTRAIRAALRQGGWQVAVHAGDPSMLRPAAARLRPAAVLVLVLEGGAALAMSRQLRVLARGCPVVFMSPREHAQSAEVLTAVREGASGWLTLDMDPLRLPHAIDGVLRGEPALPRHVVAGLLAELRHEREIFLGADGTPVELTRRELEAARLVTQGASTATVASLMRVSQTTVRGYLASVRRKLGVSGREQLAQLFDETWRTSSVTAS